MFKESVPSEACELSRKLLRRQCNVVIVDEVHERDMLTETGLLGDVCHIVFSFVDLEIPFASISIYRFRCV